MRRLVLARFISSSGFEAAFFVGLWGKIAFDLDGDAVDLAVMSAIVGLSAVVGSLAGGVLVDRHGARAVVVVSEVAFVPSTLALALFDTIPPLLAVSVLVWSLGGIIETAIVSLPPSLVSDEELERGNAHLESANWAALIAGPGIGAGLVALASIDWIFVFDAATSVVSAALVMGLVVPDRAVRVGTGGTTDIGDPTDDGARDVIVASDNPLAVGDAPEVVTGWAELRDGLTVSLRIPQIRFALVLGVLVWVAFGTFVALEPLFFRDVVGTDVVTLGWVNAIFGVGLFGGSTLLARSGGRWSGFRAAVAVNAMAGLGSAVYVVTGDLRIVALGAVLWSVPLGAALPMTRTIAQRAAPASHVGRVMGTMGTLQAGASVFPVVFAPALAGWIGVQWVLMASGLAVAVAAPAMWRWAVRLESMSSPSATPVADVAPQA